MDPHGPKRISLISTAPSRSTPGPAASSNASVPVVTKEANANKTTRTYCFNLKLGESNDVTYPEFSWTSLIRESRRKNKGKSQQNQTGGSEFMVFDQL